MTAAEATDTFAVTGRVLAGAATFDGSVVVQGTRISEVRRGAPPAGMPVFRAAVVSPGWIDLQVNGAFGRQAEDGAASVRFIAERLPATGVTAWVPTLVSLPGRRYAPLLEDLARAVPAAVAGAARVVGIHMEGPLLSSARCGAHDRAAVDAASPALFDGLPTPTVATVAPERDGAMALIARLAGRGALVALGHTDADYATFVRGVDAGARLVTHVWNAMRGIGHREPGAAGAALDDERVACGLIADGVHVHPAAVRLARRAKAPDRLVLVTDAMAGAGMPPGRFCLAGREVSSDGVAARLPDGTLAGSVLTMEQAVRNFMAMTGATLAEAVRCASEVPARLLGLTGKGCIREGGDADLVLLGDDLTVQATIVGGGIAYRRP